MSVLLVLLVPSLLISDYINHQIRVNAVNPTVVNTPMAMVGWSDPKKADPMRARIPLGRFAGMPAKNVAIHWSQQGCVSSRGVKRHLSGTGEAGQMGKKI